MRFLFIFSVILLYTNYTKSDSEKNARPFGLIWEEDKHNLNLAFVNTQDEHEAYNNFESNYKKIQQLNADEANSFKTGINKFTHRNLAELRSKILLNADQAEQVVSQAATKVVPSHLLAQSLSSASVSIPSSVDWTHTFGEVKDQGDCGSCYAFAATGVMESQYFMQTNKTIRLSEEQIVDCTMTRHFMNYGCNGGLTESSLNYARTVGIIQEDVYPYQGRSSNCPRKTIFWSERIYVKSITEYNLVDEIELKSIVANEGPVSVYINALDSLIYYTSGIYNDAACSSKPNDLNHALLLVGYGTDEATNKDYWLLRNSWGSNWGIDGYVKLARNMNNKCGIANYPIGAKLF